MIDEIVDVVRHRMPEGAGADDVRIFILAHYLAANDDDDRESQLELAGLLLHRANEVRT
jgi:hypothetical protein